MSNEDPTETEEAEEQRPEISDEDFLQAIEALSRVERTVESLTDEIDDLDTGLTRTDTVALIYGRRNGLNKGEIEDAFETLNDLTAKSDRELIKRLLSQYGDLNLSESDEFLSEVETLRNRYSDGGGA